MSTATDAQSLLQLAERKAGERDWAGAAAILANSPENVQTRSKLGFYLSRSGDYEQAREVFDALSVKHPKDPRWPYMAGYQFAQQEQWAEAIRRYSQALRLDADYLKAWYRLAQACTKCERTQDAQRAAMRVLRLWHASENEKEREREAVKMARACCILARQQLARDPAGAAELIRQGIEHCPGDANFHYLLGKALRHGGSSAEAVVSLRRASSLARGKSYQEVELACALRDTGDRAAATKLLTAVAGRLRGWDAFKGGHLALTLDEPGIAVGLFKRALESGPCRHAPHVREAYEQALRSLPAKPLTDERKTSVAAERALRGRIVLLRPERSFGFLEDENGVRRHFRMRGRSQLKKGESVVFTPVDAEKGPAARDVEPV